MRVLSTVLSRLHEVWRHNEMPLRDTVWLVEFYSYTCSSSLLAIRDVVTSYMLLVAM
jgi:hypothetical protein